ncbi:hypothetical protein GCM10027282_02010 [Frigoribacterium salinisoli]
MTTLAVKPFVVRYFDLSGKASRREYRWVQLALVLAYVAAGLLAFLARARGSPTNASGESQPGRGC